MAVPEPNGHEGEIPPGELVVSPDLTDVQKAAARLYARGFNRSAIARSLRDYITPDPKMPKDQKLVRAKYQLRKWENTGEFLDYIWQLGLLKSNLELPQILEGVARKAKRGRVDAARLILEVTGRHNPRGDQQGGNVVIQFGDGIPRPHRRIDAEGEVIQEEDED